MAVKILELTIFVWNDVCFLMCSKILFCFYDEGQKEERWSRISESKERKRCKARQRKRWVIFILGFKKKKIIFIIITVFWQRDAVFLKWWAMLLDVYQAVQIHKRFWRGRGEGKCEEIVLKIGERKGSSSVSITSVVMLKGLFTKHLLVSSRYFVPHDTDTIKMFSEPIDSIQLTAIRELGSDQITRIITFAKFNFFIAHL